MADDPHPGDLGGFFPAPQATVQRQSENRQDLNAGTNTSTKDKHLANYRWASVKGRGGGAIFLRDALITLHNYGIQYQSGTAANAGIWPPYAKDGGFSVDH
jgi:hypothetical protein